MNNWLVQVHGSIPADFPNSSSSIFGAILSGFTAPYTWGFFFKNTQSIYFPPSNKFLSHKNKKINHNCPFSTDSWFLVLGLSSIESHDEGTHALGKNWHRFPVRERIFETSHHVFQVFLNVISRVSGYFKRYVTCFRFFLMSCHVFQVFLNVMSRVSGFS
jgi:hypothetical protein